MSGPTELLSYSGSCLPKNHPSIFHKRCLLHSSLGAFPSCHWANTQEDKQAFTLMHIQTIHSPKHAEHATQKGLMFGIEPMPFLL